MGTLRPKCLLYGYMEPWVFGGFSKCIRILSAVLLIGGLGLGESVRVWCRCSRMGPQGTLVGQRHRWANPKSYTLLHMKLHITTILSPTTLLL